MIDAELKAMSDVYKALQRLDTETRNRVVDWVLKKLESPSSEGSSSGAKRGPKPGSKRKGTKRGPKPGFKRKGKSGRPPGPRNKSSASVSTNAPKRRGRPSKLKI